MIGNLHARSAEWFVAHLLLPLTKRMRPLPIFFRFSMVNFARRPSSEPNSREAEFCQFAVVTTFSHKRQQVGLCFRRWDAGDHRVKLIRDRIKRRTRKAGPFLLLTERSGGRILPMIFINAMPFGTDPEVRQCKCKETRAWS